MTNPITSSIGFTAADGRDFCCPKCKGPLQISPEKYRCEVCDRDFPIVVGIPDFRLFPDPYIDLTADREKAIRLAQQSEQTDFRGLVEYYWLITPDTPAEMAQRFTAQALSGIQRGHQLFASLTSPATGTSRRFIELGCRSGGVLAAAGGYFDQLVGIDIALRWLVIARQCLAEAGVTAQLVCCCAEHLPFAEGSFDFALAENVLEHTAAPQQLINEAHRVLQPGGVFHATTWNRFALTPEPHVRLWGVGWLPRGIARRYVKAFREDRYEHVRLRSVFEIKRLLRHSPFRQGEVSLPRFSEAELSARSSLERRLVGLYHKIKDWPLLRHALLLIAPVIRIKCVKQNSR